MDKYFICLANSYKRGGRCIAGVEITFDISGGWKVVYNKDGRPRWIRPVAKTEYGEIPNFLAENINMLSVVKLCDVTPCPGKAHTENVHFSHIEQCNYNIPHNAETLNLLIDNKHQSIFHNRGRAVSVEMLMGVNYSLMLIKPDTANAYRDENREKSKNRMKFTYYGVEYDLPITDPVFLDEFKREPNRYDDIPNLYLALSLGLEFEGWHHKLVAGVIIPIGSTKSDEKEPISYMYQQKQLHYDTSSISQNHQQFWFDEYERELVRLLDKKNEIEEQINEVRAKILQGMESHGVEKIHSEQFSVSYTPARTVVQFDSKSFRIENEELYARYCKPRVREASIVVKRNVKE